MSDILTLWTETLFQTPLTSTLILPVSRASRGVMVNETSLVASLLLHIVFDLTRCSIENSTLTIQGLTCCKIHQFKSLLLLHRWETMIVDKPVLRKPKYSRIEDVDRLPVPTWCHRLECAECKLVILTESVGRLLVFWMLNDFRHFPTITCLVFSGGNQNIQKWFIKAWTRKIPFHQAIPRWQ